MSKGVRRLAGEVKYKLILTGVAQDTPDLSLLSHRVVFELFGIGLQANDFLAELLLLRELRLQEASEPKRLQDSGGAQASEQAREEHQPHPEDGKPKASDRTPRARLQRRNLSNNFVPPNRALSPSCSSMRSN